MWAQDNSRAAFVRFREALAIHHQIHAVLAAAVDCGLLAQTAYYTGYAVRGIVRGSRSLAKLERLGDRSNRSSALVDFGRAFIALRDSTLPGLRHRLGVLGQRQVLPTEMRT